MTACRTDLDRLSRLVLAHHVAHVHPLPRVRRVRSAGIAMALDTGLPAGTVGLLDSIGQLVPRQLTAECGYQVR